MQAPKDVENIVRSCTDLIVAVVNSPNFVMTQEHKEWYLNYSWQLINKYIKESK